MGKSRNMAGSPRINDDSIRRVGLYNSGVLSGGKERQTQMTDLARFDDINRYTSRDFGSEIRTVLDRSSSN